GGFADYLFSCPIPNPSTFSKQHFIYEFVNCNPGLFICAICDGAAYTTKMASHIYTSIEHFFPRSIYPHLSVHPLNLVPICSNCNSYIKGDTNPLLLNNQPINLTDLILPYQNRKVAFASSAYLAIVPRNPRPDKNKHPLRMELRPARDFLQEQQRQNIKLQALNNLYKVDERWSEGFEEIEDQAFRRIFQFLTLAGDLDPIQEPKALGLYLRTLMSLTDQESLGKDPFAYPLTWLLKSYADQIDHLGENAPVYKAIVCWCKKNKIRIQQLIAHGKTIEDRVPLP
ncbi:MAG TPA: hypothetical protein VEA58_01875, partial [Anaerovoracaceae bacterium]|nr:hypothetical protein [Anaerovoracaceae bacterium]